MHLSRDPYQFLATIRALTARCAIIALGEGATGVGHVVRSVRACAQDVWIIGYGLGHKTLMPVLLSATRAGVDEVVIDDRREAGTLSAAVSRAWQRADLPVEVLLTYFANRLASPLLALLRQCLPLCTARTTVTQLAGSLRLHRNTLANRLERARGPNAERFRAWCILIRIAHLLDETPWSIERIALDLDFSSASALAHLVVRYVGITPTTLRSLGAVRTTADRFVTECKAHDVRRLQAQMPFAPLHDS